MFDSAKIIIVFELTKEKLLKIVNKTEIKNNGTKHCRSAVAWKDYDAEF